MLNPLESLRHWQSKTIETKQISNIDEIKLYLVKFIESIADNKTYEELKKQFELKIKKLSETYQSILKNKAFKNWIQAKGIRDQNDLNSRIFEFIEWLYHIEDESIKKLIEDIDKHELELSTTVS